MRTPTVGRANAVTPTALRLAPPLIIDETQVRDAVALIEGVLAGEATR